MIALVYCNVAYSVITDDLPQPQNIISTKKLIEYLQRKKYSIIYINDMPYFFKRLRETFGQDLDNAQVNLTNAYVIRDITYDGLYFFNASIINLPDLPIKSALNYILTLKRIYGRNPISVGKQALNLQRRKFNDLLHPLPVISNAARKYCRAAFIGGWCHKRPGVEYVDRPGIVYDVNQLYASIMRDKSLPVTQDYYFQGMPAVMGDTFYVLRFTAAFKLKAGHLPFLYPQNATSEPFIIEQREPITLTLCSIDLQLFFDNYSITDFKPIDGYYFGTYESYLFAYVETFKREREHAQDPGERAAFKILNNALYGAFALNDFKGKTIYDKGKFIYDDTYEYKTTNYIPISIAIAAYARSFIIKTAEREGKNWIYSDTDSLHCFQPSKYIKPSKDMGNFKIENNFKRARYFGKRQYVLDLGDKIKLVLAGYPKRCGHDLTFDDVKIGAKLPMWRYELQDNGTIKRYNGFYEI